MNQEKSILWLGLANKSGKLEKKCWSLFLEWMTDFCNNIVLETSFGGQNETKKLLNHTHAIIETLDSPFPEMDIEAFRISSDGQTIRKILEKLTYNADSVVEYIHFNSGTNLIASLNINDDNFLVLMLSQIEEKSLESKIKYLEENVKNCLDRKDEINLCIVEPNDIWRPLGVARQL